MTGGVDRVFIVTVLGEQAGDLSARLLRDGFYVTEINSAGSLLGESQVTFLVGTNAGRQPQLLEHIRNCCRRQVRYIPAHLEGTSALFQPAVIEAETGGAVVYALPVERWVQL
jgi:uncharacterized protein YaaQ